MTESNNAARSAGSPASMYPPNPHEPRIPLGRLAATRLLAGLVIAAGASLAHAGHVTVVASGLNNPRGLDFAPNGALYIAEAGTGGPGPTLEGPDGGLAGLGLTGSITRVFKGEQERIVTGLPSLAVQTGPTAGGGAGGPSDISFGELGHAYVTIGLGQEPSARATLGVLGAGMGWVYQMNQNGKMKPVADLAAYEEHADPDGRGADSNPQSVLADKAGAVFAIDAGGNTLLHVSAKGAVSTVAVLPFRTVQNPFTGQSMEMQPVPTNVVRGPDGALYVSELTGFPFPVGGARIYRVVPGSAPTVYASGFTNIIDLAFDAAGNLYVLELDATSLRLGGPQGRLVRVAAGGGAQVTIDVPGLIMPGGIAIGPDGALYVTNLSVAPGGGQVLRIEP